MRRKFSIACLLFAWLCANDALWNTVQVFAWARMFTGYTRALAVSEALRETFDLSKPCALCKKVSRAKEEERKQAPLQIDRSADKLLLACEAPATILFSPPTNDWGDAPLRFVLVRSEPVPVPPPRV